MKFGYAIFYVDDVEGTLAFYERAFDFEGRVVAPGEYAELSTGATRVGFANRQFMQQMTSLQVQATGLAQGPAPVEIAFVTDDVDAAFAKAVASGATAVKPPEAKPWGQRVGYLRDNNGFIVELCTAVD
jgi:lactoylglutathione lyase